MAATVADVEKGSDLSKSDSAVLTPDGNAEPILPHEEPSPSDNVAMRWAKRAERYLHLEARGIHRVTEAEQTQKTTLSFKQIVMMWLSINTAAQNITLASIGQEVYGLGFVDAMCCSIFGAIAGTIPVAYTAGWGPWSGNRTLVRIEL